MKSFKDLMGVAATNIICFNLGHMKSKHVQSFASKISDVNVSSFLDINYDKILKAVLGGCDEWNAVNVLEQAIDRGLVNKDKTKIIDGFCRKTAEHRGLVFFKVMHKIDGFWDDNDELLAVLFNETDSSGLTELLKSIIEWNDKVFEDSPLMLKTVKNRISKEEFCYIFDGISNKPEIFAKHPEILNKVFSEAPLKVMPLLIKKSGEFITKDIAQNITGLLKVNKKKVQSGYFRNLRDYDNYVVEVLDAFSENTNVVTPELISDLIDLFEDEKVYPSKQIPRILSSIDDDVLYANNCALLKKALSNITDKDSCVQALKTVPEEIMFNEENNIFKEVLSAVRQDHLLEAVQDVSWKHKSQDWVQEAISSELKNRGIIRYDMLSSTSLAAGAKTPSAE